MQLFIGDAKSSFFNTTKIQHFFWLQFKQCNSWIMTSSIWNHSITVCFPSFSSLKFILQSGVFATQQQNVLPEQRSGFPMQHCHGTCLEGGPVERLGVGASATGHPGSMYFRCSLHGLYTHKQVKDMATIGREMYKYGLHASGILVWFSQINMF